MSLSPAWRRWLSLAVLLSAAGLVWLVARPARTSAPVAAGGVLAAPAQPLRNVDGLALLSAAGTPFEVGRTQGLMLKERIPTTLAAVTAMLKRREVGWPQAVKRAAALTAYLPPPLVDELKGLAEGSGQSVADLAVLQCLPELGVWGTGGAYAALSPAARGDDLLVGAWLDAASLRPCAVVLGLAVEGDEPFVGLNLAGVLAPLAGLNAKGLAVAVGCPPRGDDAPQVPVLALVRRVLAECGDRHAAKVLLGGAANSAALSLLVTQSKPELAASVFERRGKKVAQRDSEHGLLLLTNHFRAIGRAGAVHGPTPRLCPRYDRLYAWLADQSGRLDEQSDAVAGAGLAGEATWAHVQLRPSVGGVRVSLGAGAPLALRWSATEQTLVAERAR